MAATTEYTASADAMSAQLEGEAVVLHMGTKRYFALNETAAAVWAVLECGAASRDRLVERLCDRFDVSASEAGTEVERLLQELVERDLVREVGAT